MFFFSLSRFILALRLPFVKLALALFGFKEISSPHAIKGRIADHESF
jgi:hypothetical protein